MDQIEIRVAIPADADPVEDYRDRCFAKTYSARLLAGEFEAKIEQAPDPHTDRDPPSDDATHPHRR